MRAQGVMEKTSFIQQIQICFPTPTSSPPPPTPPDPTLAAVRVKGHEGRTDEKTTQNVTGMKKVFREKLAEESSGSRTGS